MDFGTASVLTNKTVITCEHKTKYMNIKGQALALMGWLKILYI